MKSLSSSSDVLTPPTEVARPCAGHRVVSTFPVIGFGNYLSTTTVTRFHGPPSSTACWLASHFQFFVPCTVT